MALDNPFGIDEPTEDEIVDGDVDEEEGELDALLDDAEEAGGEIFDPTTMVKVRTTTGASRDVPVSGPTAIATVLERSGLAFAGAVEFWVGSNKLEPSAEVAAGTTVTVVGNVKGGQK
jgi:hypothetical protein